MANPQQQRPSQGAGSAQKTSSGAGSSGQRTAGFFQVQLRDRAQFNNFRTEQLDKQGRIQRIAGQKSHSTAWTDQELRISKECAHIENHRLVGDTEEARGYLSRLGPVEHVSGDVFRARQAEEKQQAQPQRQSEVPQRQAQSMADKEREAHSQQPAGQREQERPSPSGAGRQNPPQKQ